MELEGDGAAALLSCSRKERALLQYPENSRLKFLAYLINRKMMLALSDEAGT